MRCNYTGSARATCAFVCAFPAERRGYAQAIEHPCSAVPGNSAGGGGPAAPASFSTFTLTKLVDGTSPMLLVNAASARLLPLARIDLFDPGGSMVLTTYELSNILVLGAVVRSVLVGNTRTPTEEVSLDYQPIKQTVFTPAGPVQACWDRVQNRAC